MNTFGEARYKLSSKIMYRNKIDSIINLAIGNIPIKDLDEYKLSSFYKTLEDKEKSSHYIHGVHDILTSALEYAVTKKYIYFNPCSVVPMKKRPKGKPTIFTQEDCIEFRKLMAIDPYKNLFELLLRTRMRIGEAMGLSWDCVDMDKKKIIHT